jgi:hypothetical protein
VPIEMRAAETFAGAACCQLIELRTYKAAPLQALGGRLLWGRHSFLFASAIRVHSRLLFVVPIRHKDESRLLSVGP